MSNILVGSVNARWGRIEIFKQNDLTYHPVMVHNSGQKIELPIKHSFAGALDLAHSKVGQDPFKRMSRDPFTHSDGDVSPGQDVSKPWIKEQQELNEIDLEMQKMFGGIKPIDEQFPGYQDGYNPADSLESDNIRKEIMRMK